MKNNRWVLLTTLIVLGSANLAWPWPVPDTGLTSSVTAGDDGCYTINQMSFTVEGSTVRDNVTGLIWECKNNKDGNSDYTNPHDADNLYTFNAGIYDQREVWFFLQTLNDEAYGGYSDWRLPTLEELVSIVDFSQSEFEFHTDYFIDTQSDAYWSSSVYPTNQYDSSNYVFGMMWSQTYNQDYYLDYIMRTQECYVLAVRGRQNESTVNLIANGDGTITDLATGLMWCNVASGVMRWFSAIEFCEELSFPDESPYSDWRLPTVKELVTVLNYNNISQNRPLNTPNYYTDIFTEFINNEGYYYWTSTDSPGFDFVWYVNFLSGTADGIYRTGNEEEQSDIDGYYNLSHVNTLPVRGGQLFVQGHLYITLPRQGGMLMVGATHTITWDTADIGGSVKISLSRDGGRTFSETVAESTENDGSYEWVIPEPASYNCAIKIEPLEQGHEDKYTVQGLFTISESSDDPDDKSWNEQGDDNNGSGGNSNNSNGSGSMPLYETKKEPFCFISTAKL